ncbi:MAG: hypothetical protein M3P32_05735, partial [Chloroflexota bacterium]|nr:hypothetical protein [Chloroflexota bacterium]
ILANTAAVASSGTNDPDVANDASSATTIVVTTLPTPSPSGSLPDASAFTPGAAIGPVVLLVGFAVWIMLVSGLAVESTRRQSDRRPRLRR